MINDVDHDQVNKWAVSCSNLLARVFGESSEHYRRYLDIRPRLAMFAKAATALCGLLGVLRAAKDDYEHGYLFETRALIQAEVFDDFLEQAEYLLREGYFQPAAVLAGGVLEDGLRKLCQHKCIQLPAKTTIEPMNIELVKAGIYNVFTQKQITSLADLRKRPRMDSGTNSVHRTSRTWSSTSVSSCRSICPKCLT